MDRFGNFLIDTGLISQAQLAEALLEQVTQTPASIVVLYENGTLSAEDVLNILTVQNEELMDFRSACLKLDIWTDDFTQELRESVSKRRPKLGEIIVEKGWLFPQKLFGEIHKFKAYCAKNNLCSKLEHPEQQVDDTDTLAATATPPTKVDFNPNFAHLEEESVPDYLDIFSEEKKSALELIILSVENLKEAGEAVGPVYETLDAFFGEYHSLKGAARSVGAALTEQLIHEAEELLTFFKRFSEKVSSDDFAKLSGINLTVLDLLWDLREALLEEATEEVFWQEKTTQTSYVALLSDLRQMLVELVSRGYVVSIDDLNDEF